MKITYKTQGTCSSHIEVEVEDDVIQQVFLLGRMQWKLTRYQPIGERNESGRGLTETGRCKMRKPLHLLPGSIM